VANAPTSSTCAVVDERDQRCCARCGVYVDGGSRHHRQLRRFGDHSAANLVLLCGSGTTGCHGWVHSHPHESYLAGWLIHSWHDPAEVPYMSAMLRSYITTDREGNSHTMTLSEVTQRRIELGLSA
jgi:hypothetical protein